jgi:hypothetical protein
MIDKKTWARRLARRDRAFLRKFGFDTRKMSATDITKAAKAAAGVLQCGCGADARRGKAEADFRAFVQRWGR